METLKQQMLAEINLLQETRSHLLRRVTDMVERDGHSVHLGHNLGNLAQDIAQVDAKLEEAQKVVRTIDTLVSMAGTLGEPK